MSNAISSRKNDRKVMEAVQNFPRTGGVRALRGKKKAAIIMLTLFVVLFGVSCATVEQPRGMLGIRAPDPSLEFRQALGLGMRGGRLVVDHYFGSSADAAGIRAGDFIVAVNGQPISSSIGYEPGTLGHAIRSIGSGNTAVITIIRDGTFMDLNATLGIWDYGFVEDNRFRWPGFNVNPQGQVTQVFAGSPGDFMGIRQGDWITHINDTQITDLMSFFRVLREHADGEIWFTYVRSGVTRESLRFRR